MNLLILLAFLGWVPTAQASEISQYTVEYSTTTAPFIIGAYAHRYGVDAATMEAVIRCESRYNPYVRGDKGHSRGLAQISDIWHPEVSDTQAFDPYFSIEFLAKGLAEGRGSQWTCFRMFKAGTLGP